MYTVIAATNRAGEMQFECYGPFKSFEIAQKQANLIGYPCITFIEYLWGDVSVDKPKASVCGRIKS
jgi:hypothetical protein